MQIVPVIDLMGGQVVHARRGERERYQPLRSTLCQGAAPLSVAAGLMSLSAFRALYIADLDAIQGRGDQRAVIERIRQTHPQLELWVDAAVADRAAFDALRERGGIVPVIGSESLREAQWLAELDADAAILSLDHRGAERLGPSELWTEPRIWPRRVLAMNLARVGAGEGADLALIESLRALRDDVQVYAAGGVRDARDLAVLRDACAAGALVATALHSGAIPASALHSGAIDASGRRAFQLD